MMDHRTALLLLTICWTGVDGQKLVESPSVVKYAGESHTLTCYVIGSTSGLFTVAWFKDGPGGRKNFIAYFSSGAGITYYTDSGRGRFTMSRDNYRPELHLQMNNLRTEDSGVYYCAASTTVTGVG